MALYGRSCFQPIPRPSSRLLPCTHSSSSRPCSSRLLQPGCLASSSGTSSDDSSPSSYPADRQALVVRSAKLPSQAESVFNPTTAEDYISRVPVAATKSISDLDYLSVRRRWRRITQSDATPKASSPMHLHSCRDRAWGQANPVHQAATHHSSSCG